MSTGKIRTAISLIIVAVALGLKLDPVVTSVVFVGAVFLALCATPFVIIYIAWKQEQS